MLNWRTLAYGLGFGLLDATALPIVKGVSTGWDPAWMIIPTLMYAAAPSILLTALRKETLTIMNLVWDLSSDLTVTIIGLLVFAEKISPIKMLGVFVSFIGLILMTWESDAINGFLNQNFEGLKNVIVAS
jgi:multidrug transporter EmrE-like cation transporter